MTIRAENVAAVRVRELLGMDLRIRSYQRPYSWTPDTAAQLLDDIVDALENRPDDVYVLGSVILHADVDASDLPSSRQLDVVDGQQRLLTLRMILGMLAAQGAATPSSTVDNPLSRVRRELYRRIKAISSEARASLSRFINERCVLVQVVTDDIDEAFRIFDSQNYRGKSLAPHDLLKAHHLREMRGVSDAQQTAVVETWESVGDRELDRLFSIYLYRIMCWSRSQSAPGFTVRDLAMFKGISTTHHLPPSERYHVAAQSAIPMLNAWHTPPTQESRPEDQHVRFQLDAPILAGRPFFEMVSFMLGELDRLRADAYRGEWEPFASSALVDGEGSLRYQERPAKSRYRYVSELYLAAVLYYTNKFADDDLESALEELFAWAYSLRLNLQRVQFRSIDNHGRDGTTSAFALLCHATSSRDLQQLTASLETPREDHEPGLREILATLGAL